MVPWSSKRRLTLRTERQSTIMGCGPSKVDPEAREATAISDKIEKQLRQDAKVDQRTVKILLLGKYLPYAC